MKELSYVILLAISGVGNATDLKASTLAVAKGEGGVRHVIDQCWETDSSARKQLMKLSTNYLARLSLAEGIPAAELEQAVAAGQAAAAAKGGLTEDQCTKARLVTPKMLTERAEKSMAD